MSFIAELKRRKVLHTAGVYGVSAFGITEILTFVFENFGVPLWANRLAASLFVAGFPIAMFLSWVFDLQPGGRIKRTRFKGQSTTPIVVAAIVLLVAATAGLFYLIFPQSDPTDPIEVAAPDNSIAVLAFADMSPDQDQEYFADGLSDTLIHVLAQVNGLSVTAKTSSFSFKGRDVNVGEIARELQVGTLLEGSVQKAGNRVRVIAQLVNAADGTHLWSKRFDRDLKDIFAIQDDIAQEVVKALQITLLDTEEERLAQRYRPTLEAYEQLILGRQEMAKLTAEALVAAERHFKAAIELDPGYALAYVGLAAAYGNQSGYAGPLPEESLQLQQPLIDKALELDPLSGEAYAARAGMHMHKDRQAAEKDFLRAIELNPNYAMAHHLYYALLRSQGRFEEGLAHIRAAAHLDPMAPILERNLALAVWDVGRVEEALTLVRRSIVRNPEFPEHYHVMVIFQTRLGHVGEAQRWIREMRKRNPEGAHYWADECFGFLHLGDALAAEDCANQLSKVHPENFWAVEARFWLRLYQGDWQAAISNRESRLERAPEDRVSTWLLADLIAREGDIDRARRLMADAHPEYLEDGAELTVTDLGPALTFAAILQANGETERRDSLLLALENRIATMHRIRGRGYGITDLYIHVMRGHRDQAIAALQDSIQVGWRAAGALRRHVFWWSLRQDWKLASLHQDPEFIALVNELEADIEKQRLWYEENKDKPLL